MTISTDYIKKFNFDPLVDASRTCLVIALCLDCEDELSDFVVVSPSGELLSRGKVAFNQINNFVDLLQIENSQVFIDVGASVNAAIELCRVNGYTAFKGSSNGSNGVERIRECLITYINPLALPFCFLDEC